MSQRNGEEGGGKERGPLVLSPRMACSGGGERWERLLVFSTRIAIRIVESRLNEMGSWVSSSRLTEIGEAMREDLPWFALRGWQGWGCEGVVKGLPGFSIRGC